MKKFFIISITASLLCTAGVNFSDARKLRTHLKTPKTTSSVTNPKSSYIIPLDSLNPQNAPVDFAGFDKPTASSRESFFIINNSDSTISAIDVNINYYTMDGRQLHARRQRLEITIPPRQTRSCDIPSWDKQHSFHYYLSLEAKRGSYPFDVKITPTAIYCPK